MKGFACVRVCVCVYIYTRNYEIIIIILIYSLERRRAACSKHVRPFLSFTENLEISYNFFLLNRDENQSSFSLLLSLIWLFASSEVKKDERAKA